MSQRDDAVHAAPGRRKTDASGAESTSNESPNAAAGSASAGLQAASSRARGVIDRRSGLDRRLIAKMAAKFEADSDGEEERPAAPASADDDTYIDETGLERRRGPGRRRTDFTKAAEEGEMTQEQFLFISAIEAFKRSNSKMFPTWTDVLEVVRLLGYRKTMASELNLRNVEDWVEKPDATSGVRTKPGHPEKRRAA